MLWRLGWVGVVVLVVGFMGWDGLVWLCRGSWDRLLWLCWWSSSWVGMGWCGCVGGWWCALEKGRKEKLRVRMSEEERLRQMGERKENKIIIKLLHCCLYASIFEMALFIHAKYFGF